MTIAAPTSRRVSAAAFACLMLAAAPAGAKTTMEQAERLVGIALVTDWVAKHCGAEGLDGMLLITMPAVLKQLEPAALATGRRRVVDRAARYPSQAAACADMKADLVSIQ